MPISDAAIPSVQPCNNCQAGQMHLRYIVYFTWLADELITVPNFPAWVCDLCGTREYDPRAVNQLNLLLNPNAGKPTRRRTPPRPRRNLPKASRPITD
jgi:YgiT-type zinc finger domain-containing protein